MTHTYYELLGTRMFARELKTQLSALYAMLLSNEMEDEVFDNPEFLKEEFDRAGRLCDSVDETCDCELKRMDERRTKVKEHKEIREPRSMWEL